VEYPPAAASGIKSERIEQVLRARIEQGQWDAGTRVPSERDLAVEFGVARNTVRRAIAGLAQTGLVEASVGRGTFVASLVPPSLLAALRHAARPITPADAVEVRLLLEPPAAALAATRATPDDYAAIDAALRATLAAADHAAFEAADAALHAAVIAASRNAFLVSLYRVVVAARDEPRWAAVKRRAATPQRRALYDRQHTDIVGGLHDRDVDRAFGAMQAHLRAVQASLSEVSAGRADAD
jgi:DNA-binding FadR family transcriptional regulator